MAAEPVQRVNIAAVHGSLECAGRHVLVGHFRGVPMDGAEGFVDERLSRRLSARQLLGSYPEEVGESMFVDAPKTGDGTAPGYPPGALVLGLGRPGELTREKLTTAVSSALIGRAVVTMEERLSCAGPVPAPALLLFSAVAVGTSGVGGMSVEGCAAGLVDGVLAANEKLHGHVDPRSGVRAWDHVRIAGLEILEVLADKAEQVAHAVIRAQDLLQVPTGEHTELVLAQCLIEGEGGLPAWVPGEHQAGEWQRVIIRDVGRERLDGDEPPAAAADGTAVLEFTAIGRRARADRMQVTIDCRSVESLVAGAVRDARPGGQVGNTLYELLLPPDLKSDLARSENVQFIVDEHTADFPWEALAARVGGARRREMALRGGFLRQFRETEGSRAEARAPAGENALVIGNPPAGGGLPSLAGAREEAETVAGVLSKQGFDVSALVWDGDGKTTLDSFPDLEGSPGRRVLDALFSHDWRIVHMSAHGSFDAGDSSRSGVVIDGETSVSANVVRQLPVVPELVFLNCCHLGRLAGGQGATSEPNRLAASVARELMRIGVRAVVAAGWAIDDQAAVLFARTFYDRLLDGDFLGTAVHCARTQVHERFGAGNTWAAFQCYGDPGYRLRSTQAPPPPAPVVVSSDELVRRVRTIAVLAGKIGMPNFEDVSHREEELVEELDAWRARLSTRGWETPVVLYELGTAYGELGNYEKAVECYRRAWDDAAANTAPVKLVEQLGNFECRMAQRLFRKGADQSAVAAMVASAGDHLHLALGLGETTERLALLGSFHKRAAAIAGGDRRQEHLLESARHYERAHRLHVELRSSPDAYYTLNWLQAATLAGAPVDSSEADGLLAALEAWSARPGKEDFWTRATLANIALTRAVVSHSSDLEQPEARYRWAFGTRSSRRHRDSVIDHIRDLADLLENGEALRDLAGRLDQVGPAGTAEKRMVEGQVLSRWTMSKENAGRQIETYSAPSGPGVL